MFDFNFSYWAVKHILTYICLLHKDLIYLIAFPSQIFLQMRYLAFLLVLYFGKCRTGQENNTLASLVSMIELFENMMTGLDLDDEWNILGQEFYLMHLKVLTGLF